MFFKKSVVGLDISDTAIKLVVLDKNKSLVAHADHKLTEGIVSDGVITDCEKFVKEAKKVFVQVDDISNSSQIIAPEAIVSLPEGKVWSHTIVIPKEIAVSQRQTFIYEEASKIIPHDLSHFYTTSCILEVRGTSLATFVAAEKSVVDTYRSCLSEAGLHVSFIGSNFYSIARAVLPKKFGEDNYLIIDIGGFQTSIGAFDENSIAYITVQSARVDTHENTDTLRVILDDVLKVQDYFETYTGQKITKVLLTGQIKELSTFVQFFENNIEIPVSVAETHTHVKFSTKHDSSMQSTSYANVIGLALYGVDRTFPHMNLLPEEKRYSSLKENQTLKNVLINILDRSKNLSSVLKHSQLQNDKNYAFIGSIVLTILALAFLVYVVIMYI